MKIDARAREIVRNLHRGDDARPLCTGSTHVFPTNEPRCTCGRRNIEGRRHAFFVECDEVDSEMITATLLQDIRARALLPTLSGPQRREILRCQANEIVHDASIDVVFELRALGVISMECWSLLPLGEALADLLAQPSGQLVDDVAVKIHATHEDGERCG